MAVEFARLEGKSTPYYTAMLLLAGLGLAGTFATYYMHVHGLYLSGMTNRVPWNSIEVADALSTHREVLEDGGIFPATLIERLIEHIRG